jgi:hypothetical protein
MSTLKVEQIKQTTFNFEKLSENIDQDSKVTEQTSAQKQEEKTEIIPERIFFEDKCKKALLPIFEKIRQDYIQDFRAQITTRVGELFYCDYFSITIEWDFIKENYYSTEERSLKSVSLIVFRDIFNSYKSNHAKFENRGWKIWDLTPATTDKKTYVYLIKEASKMKRLGTKKCWDMENCTTLDDPNLEKKVLRAIKRQLKYPEQN